MKKTATHAFPSRWFNLQCIIMISQHQINLDIIQKVYKRSIKLPYEKNKNPNDKHEINFK